MKRLFILTICICLPLASFTRHPVESLSVGEVTYRENGIHIKVKCLEEGLRASLINFTHRNIVFDYDEPTFNKELLRIVESYFKVHLLLTVNSKPLQLKLKNVSWVEGTQASDHAAINVEIAYPSLSPAKIKMLEIKNTLLMSVPEQMNILNLKLGTETEMLSFKKGKETAQIVF